jgi:Glycine-rich domain-containing protein-like
MNNKSHWGKVGLVVGTPLAGYTRISNEDLTWKNFFDAFRETLTELKAEGKFKDISNRNIFARLRAAYMGIVWRDLSIDLVAASLRQREFARKITGEECQGMDSPFALYKATTRYHKFLLLLKRSQPSNEKNPMRRKKMSFFKAMSEQPSSTRVPKHLVPTLDIDLCWHTHQLFPRAYREWCLEHLGRAVNHDDTIGKESLDHGLRSTSLAWLEAYREPYTSDDVRKAYLTPARKVAGVLFPPYGLHLLNKERKLKQAQLGM